MTFNRYFLICTIFFILACNKEENNPVPPSTLTFSQSIKILQDDFGSVPLVLVGSAGQNFLKAFERTLPDGTLLEFELVQLDFPVVLKDQEGNDWDLNGYAVRGPREGQNLTTPHSFIGFWFAWGTMYPGIEIYNGPAYEGDFEQEPAEEDWTIPITTVASAVGLDGIPAVDNPKFETFVERDVLEEGYFVEDYELVTGITIDGITHLYPHKILNWHEIVNDEINGTFFSLSFCPLTGTSIAWDRVLENGLTTFGVSGLLYNSNLIPYDRATTSFWTQMGNECVNGDLFNQQMKIFPVLETTWQTWKTFLVEPLVLTPDTGVSKDYETNPYQNYITDHNSVAFPIEYDDTRLPRKERVLGVVINGKAKAYRFSDF